MNIAEAIRNRFVLTFSYHGHHRVVEPHTYGMDGKGHMVLRAYQIGGTSGSGRIPAWRIFHEADILSLATTEAKFASAAPDYVANDPFFSTIHAQI